MTDGTSLGGLLVNAGNAKAVTGYYNQNVGTSPAFGAGLGSGDKVAGVVTSGASGLYADLTQATAAYHLAHRALTTSESGKTGEVD